MSLDYHIWLLLDYHIWLSHDYHTWTLHDAIIQTLYLGTNTKTPFALREMMTALTMHLSLSLWLVK